MTDKTESEIRVERVAVGYCDGCSHRGNVVSVAGKCADVYFCSKCLNWLKAKLRGFLDDG